MIYCDIKDVFNSKKDTYYLSRSSRKLYKYEIEKALLFEVSYIVADVNINEEETRQVYREVLNVVPLTEGILREFFIPVSLEGFKSDDDISGAVCIKLPMKLSSVGDILIPRDPLPEPKSIYTKNDLFHVYYKPLYGRNLEFEAIYTPFNNKYYVEDPETNKLYDIDETTLFEVAYIS